jgi:transposase
VIGLPQTVKIMLFAEPADMRKGFEGLGALVLAADEDLYSGHLYVFVSKRRNRIKILSYDKGGFVLWYKRLEQGCFRTKAEAGRGQVSLDATELAMLLDGIEVSRVRRPQHWQPRQK